MRSSVLGATLRYHHGQYACGGPSSSAQEHRRCGRLLPVNTDFPLPRGLRNHIFAFIQEAALDPLAFVWTSVLNHSNQTVSQLTHPDTGFFLLFNLNTSRGFFLQSWPTLDDTRARKKRWSDESNDAVALNYAAEWISVIAPQIKAPDLWELAAAQPRFSGEAAAGANTVFSPAHGSILRVGAGTSLHSGATLGRLRRAVCAPAR